MLAQDQAILARPGLDAGTTSPAAQGSVPVRPKIDVADMNFFYGDNHVLHDVTVKMLPNQVTALIGPSGCGKSTFLRSLNRMNDIIPGTRVAGSVCIDNKDIYDSAVDVVNLRRRVGMVFQKSNPFPKSIFENVAYGLRINRMTTSRAELSGRVEASLKSAALWDEVKDRLHDSALALSGGQQQRLCIARALAVEPDILLMDEPASALDPIATQRIEELIYQLKARYTIIIVTHNMQQASRVSDVTGFFWLGRLVECDRTDKIFTAPTQKLTEDYVTGRFGYEGPLMAPVNASCRISAKSLSSASARLLEMGGMAEEEVRLSIKGLVERDNALRAGDARDGPLNLAAHRDRQPLLHAAGAPPADGADLRTIVAAVKINTDLERVGDLAVNIAEAATRYTRHAQVKRLIDIPTMADIAQSMLRDALDAFVRLDTALAQHVLDEDDKLDALKTQIFRELLTYMLQDLSTIEPALDLILVSRHLEGSATTRPTSPKMSSSSSPHATSAITFGPGSAPAADSTCHCHLVIWSLIG